MPPVGVELGQVVQLYQFAVDAGADKALGPHLLEQLLVLALAVFHQGCQQHQAVAFGQRQHLIHHLAHGLGLQRVAVLGAARGAGAGEQ